MRKLLPALILLVGFVITACKPAEAPHPTGGATSAGTPPAEDLATARKRFNTNLHVRGPAPQDYEQDSPPPGVQQVEFVSGNLTLKGWLTADPGDGKKHPAVVFLHGGFAFGGDDWKDAARFAKAGFVLFMPMLRGENGNPGNYESFYGEVDDAIAAGNHVASLPYVDSRNVFVSGHSVGAVLTCLVAEMPSPYKAAAALDGYVNMEMWVKRFPPALMPYDRNDKDEVRMRDPMAFVATIRCPLSLYASDTFIINKLFAEKAERVGVKCQLVEVQGDHMTMVEPAVKLAIEWFKKEMAK